MWDHSPSPARKFHDKHLPLRLDVPRWDLPCLVLSKLCEADVSSALAGYHSCFRRISEETISLWQSEFVILSNHLGCLQNFSRWQRFVDKCFVSQVISFSATVAILINWTYDHVCQDWKYCHSMQRVLLSELTATSIVLEMEQCALEQLCVCCYTEEWERQGKGLVSKAREEEGEHEGIKIRCAAPLPGWLRWNSGWPKCVSPSWMLYSIPNDPEGEAGNAKETDPESLA